MQLGRGVALRRTLLAATILAGVARSVHAGNYAWTTAGPQPGYVFQVLIDPQDSQRISAGAGFFGPILFQSSDRGQAWREQGTILFNGRLVPDPANGNVLYTIGLFGDASGVIKSLDGGAMWTAAGAGLPASQTVSAIAISPSDPQTLYALLGGAPGSVYRTHDGAATWALVSSTFPSNYVNDVRVDPQDSGILYATSYGDVVKSVDGGASWANTGLGLDPARIVIDSADPRRVFAGTNGSGVFVSPDGGVTWTSANVGIETHSVRDMALDPAHPQTLWVGTSATGAAGGVFMTANAHDWSRVDFGETVSIGTAVAVDPADPAVVYAGAGHSVLLGSLFRSVDGGGTWLHVDRGLSGYMTNGVVADAAQAPTAYTIASGKVFRTEDSGSDWSVRADTGFALITLAQAPSIPDTLFAGYVFPDFTGNGALKSVDGGMTWNPATNGLSVNTLHRLAISPAAGDHVLAASFDGLSQTVDGGGLWTLVLGTGDVRSCAYDPLDASILYAGVGYGSLFRSADGGSIWNPPTGIPGFSVNNWDLSTPSNDPSRVYLATSVGVYRSLNRGLDFAAANTGLPPAPATQPYRLAADPSHAGTLYILALLGGAAADGPLQAPQPNVYRTANGGDAWAPLPGFLPALNSYELTVSADGRTLYAATVSGTFQFERSFLDVPDTDPFWPWVDAAAMNGVTSGCGSGSFCPDQPTSRATIAVFLLRGKNGVGYAPPPATGTVFGDVPASAFAASFIEELSVQGITAGCGGGNYCPDTALTRAEVAVLLLKTKHGSNFVPPPATGMVFNDVPAGAFAADWIEQLALEGVTAGCGGGDFCPDAPVSRAQAAALVVLAFGLS